MCIAAQRVSKDELYIELTDGRTYTITRAQVLALYQQQSGNAANRKAATILVIKNQIVAAFGAALIDVNALTIDFDQADANKAMRCTMRF